MQSASFLLIIFSLSTVESIQYVKPNASSYCPGQPCLTLDLYVQESSKYFTTGSTFVFLPGNHSLETSLNITAVSNISFRGSENENHPVVICTDEVTVSNVTGLDIDGIIFLLNLTQQEGNSLSAFVFSSSQELLINNSIFRKVDIHLPGRAILSTDSGVAIVNCLFEGNTGYYYGGAIIAQLGTVMTLTGNNFTSNRAISGSGGAIYAVKSTISLRGNNFSHNSGYSNGGAIYCYRCTVVTMKDNIFCNNFLTGSEPSVMGGAIAIKDGNISATGSANFSNNKAVRGGAISLFATRAEFRGGIFMFKENIAAYVGGGMYISASSNSFTADRDTFTTYEHNFTFIGNVAEGNGPSEVCGVMCIFSTKHSITNNISVTLVSNSGTSGGALFIEKTSGFTLNNVHARNNSGGALGILYAPAAKVLGTNLFLNNRNLKKGTITIVASDAIFNGSNKFDYNCAGKGAIFTNISNVTFIGTTSISNNIGRSGGGGIDSLESMLLFKGETILLSYCGTIGGGMRKEREALHLYGNTSFINNTATTHGGGIYAERETLRFSVNTSFINNTATTLLLMVGDCSLQARVSTWKTVSPFP